MGRRQRPHHRHPLQDRRGGPGRGGGHTLTAMRALDAIRPAGVGSVGEGIRAVGVPDRPSGEGDRESRRPSRLRVLQRPQRPGGHGEADGPERRAHPRDRAPGPLETGRRHGRPLHPQRVSRIGAAVPMTIMSFHRRPPKPRWPTAGSKAVIVDEVLCTLYTVTVYVVHGRLE